MIMKFLDRLVYGRKNNEIESLVSLCERLDIALDSCKEERNNLEDELKEQDEELKRLEKELVEANRIQRDITAATNYMLSRPSLDPSAWFTHFAMGTLSAAESERFTKWRADRAIALDRAKALEEKRNRLLPHQPGFNARPAQPGALAKQPDLA